MAHTHTHHACDEKCGWLLIHSYLEADLIAHDGSRTRRGRRPLSLSRHWELAGWGFLASPWLLGFPLCGWVGVH